MTQKSVEIPMRYTVRVKPLYILSHKFYYNEPTDNFYELKYKYFKYQKNAEKFIDQHLDEIDWEDLSEHFDMDEKYLRKYFNYLNPYLLCQHVPLSESFIREYKDYVDWIGVSECQDISKEFINEFKNNIIPTLLCNNPHIHNYDF